MLLRGATQSYNLAEDYANVTDIEIVEDFRSTHAVLTCTFMLPQAANFSEGPPIYLAGIDWDVLSCRAVPTADGQYAHSVLAYAKGMLEVVDEPILTLRELGVKMGVDSNTALFTSLDCPFPVAGIMVSHLLYRWRLNSMELNRDDPKKYTWIYNGLSGFCAGVLGLTMKLPPRVADLSVGVPMGMQQSMVMDRKLGGFTADQPPFKTGYMSYFKTIFPYKFEVEGQSRGTVGAMYSFQNGMSGTDSGQWMLIRQVYRQASSPNGWRCTFAKMG